MCAARTRYLSGKKLMNVLVKDSCEAVGKTIDRTCILLYISCLHFNSVVKLERDYVEDMML